MKKPWIEKLFFMVSEFTCMGFSWGFFNSCPIKNHEFSVNGWILMVHEKWNGFWWHFHYPWIMPLAYFSWERQRVSGLIKKKKKKKPQSAVCMVCVLTWLHFSMVYDSVNQAINDKKVSLQYKIHLEYMYIQLVLYLLSRLQSWCSKFHHWKWTTNFKGSILLSLDKLQWNEKSLFSRPIQMFI